MHTGHRVIDMYENIGIYCILYSMINDQKDGWNNSLTRGHIEREEFTMLSRDTRFSVRRQSIKWAVQFVNQLKETIVLIVPSIECYSVHD
jgi:hypothetical protein